MMFVLSGLLLGAAHLHEHLAPLAWLGFAVLVAAMERAPGPRQRLLGALASCALQYAVALHWLVHPIRGYLGGTPLAAAGLLAVLVGVITGGSQAPVLLAALLPRRWPAGAWLPPAWLVGEFLLERLTELAWGQWLYSQWAVPPVLNTLSLLGWYPTALLCLYAAAGLGTAAARARLAPALAAVALILGMACLQALAESPVGLKQIIGALVLRGVEFHLPAVRASMWGRALVVTADGRIVQQSAPGPGTVLMLDEPPAVARARL